MFLPKEERPFTKIRIIPVIRLLWRPRVSVLNLDTVEETSITKVDLVVLAAKASLVFVQLIECLTFPQSATAFFLSIEIIFSKNIILLLIALYSQFRRVWRCWKLLLLRPIVPLTLRSVEQDISTFELKLGEVFSLVIFVSHVELVEDLQGYLVD